LGSALTGGGVEEGFGGMLAPDKKKRGRGEREGGKSQETKGKGQKSKERAKDPWERAKSEQLNPYKNKGNWR
jgi:hypothetical protein